MSKEYKTVLVVEDDLGVCLAMRKVLTDTYIVHVVHTINDAFNYLKVHQPSYIFLDNKLPDGFGIDHLSELRNKNKAVFIIMMTSGTGGRLEKEAINSGANMYLPKPFELSAVKEMLENSQS